MFDNNLHLVGGTIQTLSKNLDEGRILKYCFPPLNYNNFNPFMFSMNAVKETFIQTVDVINNYKFYLENSQPNDNSKLIGHSKISDFNENVIRKFYEIDFNLIDIDNRRQK